MNRQQCLLIIFICLFNQFVWGMESLDDRSLETIFKSRYQNVPTNSNSLPVNLTQPILNKIQEICFSIDAMKIQIDLTDLLIKSELKFFIISLPDGFKKNIFDMVISPADAQYLEYTNFFYCKNGSLLSLYDWLLHLVQTADYLHAVAYNDGFIDQNYQFLKDLLKNKMKPVTPPDQNSAIKLVNLSPKEQYLKKMEEGIQKLKLANLYIFIQKLIEYMLINKDLFDLDWVESSFKKLNRKFSCPRIGETNLNPIDLNNYIEDFLKNEGINMTEKEVRKFTIDFIIEGADEKFKAHWDHVKILDARVDKKDS